MATRNLTAQFLKLRNERGGIRRPRPSGTVSDDKPLIGADSAGAGFDRTSLPPLWVDAVDAIHEDVDAIRRKSAFSAVRSCICADARTPARSAAAGGPAQAQADGVVR